ncbi:MAG: caspase family protein [Campylobacterota bacterium]|nr:caspase family protein [Campylobacterota bacterium]
MNTIKKIVVALMLTISLSANTYDVKLTELEKVTALTNIFVKKELFTKKPSFPQKPLKPKILPPIKELTKGKYEKTITFEKRISDAKTKRSLEIQGIENRYAEKVKIYNKKVKDLTDAYNNAVAKKRNNIKAITLNAMQKAYSIIYKKPYLENSLKYDADSETFYGIVKSEKGDFKEKISFNVPIEKAEYFEKNIKYIKPKLEFSYENAKLSLKTLSLTLSNQEYKAILNSDNFKPKNITVSINNGSLNLPVSPLLSRSLDIDSSAYGIGEINYSKDPEIAQLQKRKWKLEQNARSKKQSLARKEQLKTQKLALEAQIALLEDTKGGVDDISQYLSNAKGLQTDSKKWLFIIGIENYEYTDPVAYSSNSAKQFKKVMQKRLGIAENHTRTLINRDATGSKIDYTLKDMLRRVKKEDTVYFYYSGHGIPLASQNNTPFMLAQDMNPSDLSDKRFKLQNIYKALSNSKAKKVIAFVDSCFSGGTDNQALIKGVAATRVVPKRVTFNKKKMLVISAGRDTQYSNKFDEKSNRLFSYYLMRGLIKNNSNIDRLYSYVKSNVQEKSYEMGASYEQVPVFDGNIGLGL